MIFPQSDIRNQIIFILSEDFPLTFRKLDNKLKKDYHKSIPDKTLYRLIKLMIDDKILLRKNNEYMINPEWLENLDQFVNGTAKNYINGKTDQKHKQKIYGFVKQECSCGKANAEGFCFICNEPVCEECGEKTRLHYSCLDKCNVCSEDSDKFVGKCTNCLKDACISCSKEVWAHFSENCLKKPDKAIFSILEVDHECWFADLSEKIENPIVLNTFVDAQDQILGTHSGRIIIQTANQKQVINHLLNHKQIVDVKPIYSDEQLVLRTRALFNRSVEEFVRKNKSILLNPIEAKNTKERNLIISPSQKEMSKLMKGLNEVGKCRLVACEEVELNKISIISSKEIRSFVFKPIEENPSKGLGYSLGSFEYIFSNSFFSIFSDF